MEATGKAVAEQMIRLVGTPYSRLDCQGVIEEAVKAAGGHMAYRGSNDMARNLAWLGTLENAKAAFDGKLPVGAGLFIHEEESESTPARYRGDGLGDFTHVGLYVGADALTDTDKSGRRRSCDVVHSSQSMGRVAGSTMKNGWTHVGFFKEIDCGVAFDGGVELSPAAKDILNQTTDAEENAGDAAISDSVQPNRPAYVNVTSADGNPVRIREKPEKGAIYKYKAPVGTRLMVMGEKNGFYKVMYNGKARWIMKEFTEAEG